jgi:orotate phosphoribosyltransferase
MPSETLALGLARAGLIQFGQFVQPDGTTWPVAVHLRWLPSYPALLHDVAVALSPLLDQVKADRLLTTVDALPIGIALGLHSGLPVVYPYGEVRDYTAAYAIEGAYDVGHPTALLTDVLVDATQAQQITALARRVGLEVDSVLAVVDLGQGGREELAADGYSVHGLWSLHEILPLLETASLLPPVMRATVEEWATQRSRSV